MTTANAIKSNGSSNGTYWDEASVKDLLPDVQVKLPDGTIITGSLAGRKMPEPGVWVKMHGLDICLATWSWSCVARALNEGRPLLA